MTEGVGTIQWIGTGGPRLVDRMEHRRWLMRQATDLLEFFRSSIFNPAGGFFSLDDEGNPFAAENASGVVRQIHDTTRMVHCFVIGHLLGFPGSDRIIDHGMRFLWERHRDTRNGGYFWSVDDVGATDARKQAYGHAFVLLAASSAKVVGHPDADRLMNDLAEILHERFWDQNAGATTEEYGEAWSEIGSYRGQNSNMHLTEAVMAAFEATGDQQWLSMGESIADLIIGRHAREQGWRVAEHFTGAWQVDRDYEGDPTFRPAGTTPGHALEWSRLLIQLWELGGRRKDWLPDAARNLFLRTADIGWDRKIGGFYYTLDWQDRPARADRFWWACAEGIAAAAVLGDVDKDRRFEEWYRRIWDFSTSHLIDHRRGGWFPELGPDLQPVNRVFRGKPDLYHALQACLVPLLPSDGSITRGLLRGLAG